MSGEKAAETIRSPTSNASGSDCQSLVFATNAGASEMARNSIGFTDQDHSHDDEKVIKRLFTPEFRNRLDSIIRFNPLDEKTILLVVDKFLMELEQQLQEKNVTLGVDVKARKWLGKKGFNAAMGARPMARVIQDHIKIPVANELLFGDLADGGNLNVTVKNDSLHLKCLTTKVLVKT